MAASLAPRLVSLSEFLAAYHKVDISTVNGSGSRLTEKPQWGICSFANFARVHETLMRGPPRSDDHISPGYTCQERICSRERNGCLTKGIPGIWSWTFAFAWLGLDGRGLPSRVEFERPEDTSLELG